MGTRAKKIFAGIDWGTHSSKWAADILLDDGTELYLTGIKSSDLIVSDGQITMSPSEGYLPEIRRVSSFKRYIINDPYTPFWSYRDDIKMSMGGGVCFSICSLFGDYLSKLSGRGIIYDTFTEIEIGFSFPNWLKETDEKSRKAASNFHEAIVIACCLFNLNEIDFPIAGKQYSVQKWEASLRKVKEGLVFPKETKLSISDMTTKKYAPVEFSGGDGNIYWSYLVESCAAGLPYLRNIDLMTPPGAPGLGKLLVIDIGAGSTDIGYMLRTLNRENGRENLFYFAPAPTLAIAGNVLTEEIRDFHQAIGKPITFQEAENFKLTNSAAWINKPFVERWKQQIREHIEDYISNCPDKRWLDMRVPLQVILTGGCAVVEGLSNELKDAVNNGLKKRGFRTGKTDVTVISDNLFSKTFKIKDDYARMAVAIGSADKDKPSLKYLRKMDPPTRISTRVIKY